MRARVVTILVLVGLLACSRHRSPEQAKAELQKQGFEFTSSALISAARGTDDARTGGKPDLVALFLDAGMDPNVRGDKGTSAMHKAALGGHADVLKVLVARGGDVNARDGKQDTPLMNAAQSDDNVEAAKFLLDHGADVNAKGDCRSTALVGAVMFGMLDMVRLLVSKGADVNAADEFQRTPMWWAQPGHGADGNRAEIQKILKEAGAR